MHNQEIANELAIRGIRGEKNQVWEQFIRLLVVLKIWVSLVRKKEGKTITYRLSARGEKAFGIVKKRWR